MIPISSQISQLYPAETYVTLNGEQRKAMADQLTTVSKARLRRRQGRLSKQDIGSVERVVSVQLGL